MKARWLLASLGTTRSMPDRNSVSSSSRSKSKPGESGSSECVVNQLRCMVGWCSGGRCERAWATMRLCNSMDFATSQLMLEVMAEEKGRGCIQDTIEVAAVGSPQDEPNKRSQRFPGRSLRECRGSRVAENAQMSWRFRKPPLSSPNHEDKKARKVHRLVLKYTRCRNEPGFPIIPMPHHIITPPSSPHQPPPHSPPPNASTTNSS